MSAFFTSTAQAADQTFQNQPVLNMRPKHWGETSKNVNISSTITDSQNIVMVSRPTSIEEVVIKPEIISLYKQNKSPFGLLVAMAKGVKSYNENLDLQYLEAALLKAKSYIPVSMKICLSSGKAFLTLSHSPACATTEKNPNDMVVGIAKLSF